MLRHDIAMLSRHELMVVNAQFMIQRSQIQTSGCTTEDDITRLHLNVIAEESNV